MRKRARLIYNPISGREQVKKSLSDLLQVYEEADYDTSCFQTTPEPLSAQKEARRCAEDGYDLIIAAGGDGTLNEVINGISPLDKRPKLAIIPAGTTNDFARALCLPRNDLIKAAEVIKQSDSVQMDMGKVSLEDKGGQTVEKYFMNIGAAGTLTELTYDVPSQLKSIFGSLAYFAKGAELLPRLDGTPIKIEYDDGVYDGEASMVFVALTNSVGGFEKIAPDNIMGDGKFTLIIVTTSNLVEMIQIGREILKDGTHIENKNVVYAKTTQVSIQTQKRDELLINLDGELGGKAPATFENIQKHIEVVANTSEMKSAIEIDSDKLN